MTPGEIIEVNINELEAFLRRCHLLPTDQQLTWRLFEAFQTAFYDDTLCMTRKLWQTMARLENKRHAKAFVKSLRPYYLKAYPDDVIPYFPPEEDAHGEAFLKELREDNKPLTLLEPVRESGTGVLLRLIEPVVGFLDRLMRRMKHEKRNQE